MNLTPQIVKKKYAEIFNDLEKELKKIEKQVETTLNIADKSITAIDTTTRQIRKMVTLKGFESDQDEINFFKIIKPKIVSKLIYFVNVFKIENNRPVGSIKVQKKYFENEIYNLQQYFNDNILYLQYFRNGETNLDHQYFLRKNKSVKTHFECFGSYIDDDFAASLDSTFSKFIGFELLIEYLQNEIDNLSIKSSKPNMLISKLNWTGPKVGLIELIYALFESKVINNGSTDIKELACTFEKLFKIDLGDYYRSFTEIRQRKQSATKSLDLITLNLKKRIEKFEE